MKLLPKPHAPSSSGRYHLTSPTRKPFKINNIYTADAFLSRGSTVDLGYNRLIFNDMEEKKVCSPISNVPTRVVNGKFNILLEGETGTGKTRLAKIIHEASSVTGNYVHLNLAAFSYSLLESELFGHVKGSFTGAIRDRIGAFEQAKNGTLFLDEIDSLPMEIQVKLLLVLESMCIRPVGAEFTRNIETRIIFASGQPLRKMVQEKKFRKDLFYRINRGFQVRLSPLREQPNLIERLIRDFLRQNNLSVLQNLSNFTNPSNGQAISDNFLDIWKGKCLEAKEFTWATTEKMKYSAKQTFQLSKKTLPLFPWRKLR